MSLCRHRRLGPQVKAAFGGRDDAHRGGQLDLRRPDVGCQ